MQMAKSNKTWEREVLNINYDSMCITERHSKPDCYSELNLWQ